MKASACRGPTTRRFRRADQALARDAPLQPRPRIHRARIGRTIQRLERLQALLEQGTRRVADEIIKKSGVKLDYLVGTMIELPRAALLADQVAEVAEFFSFGTNDLTQTTMGLSRDDAGRFLPDYVDPHKAGIFHDDPFQTLDEAGVGRPIAATPRVTVRSPYRPPVTNSFTITFTD